MGDKEVVKVDPEELYDPSQGGLPGASVVNVDGVEADKPNETPAKSEQGVEQSPQTSEPATHETDNVKTTVTEQEDENYKPSMKDKMKEKLTQVGDKFRSKEAVEAKKGDPHPELV